MKRTRIALAAAAVSLAVAAQAPAAAPTKLTATVGPGFTITLTKAGKRVTTLKPGRYSITVRDRSDFHNFRLRGPGRVNRATTVAEMRTRTWTVTLVRGRYSYVCDPHASSMKGAFTVRS
jgi:plastocyanin